MSWRSDALHLGSRSHPCFQIPQTSPNQKSRHEPWLKNKGLNPGFRELFHPYLSLFPLIKMQMVEQLLWQGVLSVKVQATQKPKKEKQESIILMMAASLLLPCSPVCLPFEIWTPLFVSVADQLSLRGWEGWEYVEWAIDFCEDCFFVIHIRSQQILKEVSCIKQDALKSLSIH